MGLLTTVIQELCDLISDVTSGEYSNSSVSVTDLEIELHRAQEAVDRMTKDMEAKAEELKRRGDSIMELTSKVRINCFTISVCCIFKLVLKLNIF